MSGRRHVVAWLAALATAGCASLALDGGELTTPERRASTAAAASAEARIAEDRDRPASARYRDLYPDQPPSCGADVADGCAPAWSMTVRPTEDELSEAARQLARAGRQRARLPQLAAAEAQSCVGLSPGDRDMSPFARRRDVVGVDAIEGGAAVRFARVAGLTIAALQEMVACHLARDVALAADRLQPSDCPLGVAGASARVRATPGGMVVDVTAIDPTAAREILRRARAVAPTDGRRPDLVRS